MDVGTVVKKTGQDGLPHVSHPYPQTHPNRLATIATLFGMKPQKITACRVLELGAANGANLIPMAYGLPKSEFIGIEKLAIEVAKAKKTIEALELKNIEIKQLDILDIEPSLGKFDYIIVHDLYSWVAPEVQHKILEVIRDLLNPKGVAYVSYNTYPGWHVRGMMQEMMRYHARNFSDAKQAVGQARALVNFLSAATSMEASPYGLLVKSELDEMNKWEDGYFYDVLEERNTPVYFHEFAEQANKHKLQYLGESDLHTMMVGNFAPDVQETLKKIGGNIITMEQYMDFIRNRMSRQTLLCHSNVKLNRHISPNVMKSLYFSAGLQAISPHPDVMSDKVEKFRTGVGVEVTANSPIAKAIWIYFASQWPKPVKLSEVAAAVQSQMNQGGVALESMMQGNRGIQLVSDILFVGCIKGLVQLSADPLPIMLRVSERPSVTPLVRYEAQNQLWVTNLRHEAIYFDNLNRHLLQYLDGQHEPKDLLQVLSELVVKGDIKIMHEGAVVSDRGEIKNIIVKRLQAVLPHLARLGLLVG